MAISLDFSSVKGFDPVPEGTYVARIEKAEEKTSKAGNPMIQVTYEIIDGDQSGRKVFESYPLMENVLWKLQQLLTSLGIDAMSDLELDLNSDLLGKVVSLDVTITQYNGKESNSIKSHSEAPIEFTLV